MVQMLWNMILVLAIVSLILSNGSPVVTGATNDESKELTIPSELLGKVVPHHLAKPCKDCNKHNDSIWLAPSNPCNKSTVEIVILVRSAVVHGARRIAIRETWAGRQYPWVKVIFILANPDSEAQEEVIQQEANRFNDILQGYFAEEYNSLPLKNLLAWKWVAATCGHVQHVVVSSDESFIDVVKLRHYTRYLGAAGPRQDAAVTLCYLFPCCMRVWHDHPKYKPQPLFDGPYYDSNAYPAYCSGAAYMMPAKLLGQVYAAGLETPAFMPDDVWLGVLMLKLNFSLRDTYTAFAGLKQRENVLASFSNLEYNKSPVMIGVTDVHFPDREPDAIRRLWQYVSDHHKDGPVNTDFAGFPLVHPGHPHTRGKPEKKAGEQKPVVKFYTHRTGLPQDDSDSPFFTFTWGVLFINASLLTVAVLYCVKRRRRFKMK